MGIRMVKFSSLDWVVERLSHTCKTAYSDDSHRFWIFWKVESVFLVSCLSCCHTCLLILGATRFSQFCGSRYLSWTDSSFSLDNLSVNKSLTIVAKPVSIDGPVFSVVLNCSANDYCNKCKWEHCNKCKWEHYQFGGHCTVKVILYKTRCTEYIV